MLLQRVASASVQVESQPIAEIGPGLLALIGVFPEDGPAQAQWLAEKTLGLRIFPDQGWVEPSAGEREGPAPRIKEPSATEREGPAPRKNMNRSVLEVGGAILAVSQFTLAADVRKGKRPSFSRAAPPEQAERLYLAYVEALRVHCAEVRTGRFGANMQVALVNDGPVTFLLER